MAVTTHDLKKWGITKILDDMMCDELFGPEKTMTDDLVKRLRVQADSAYISSMLEEAADRIEALEAALDDVLQHVSRADWHYLKDETRAALAGGDEK